MKISPNMFAPSIGAQNFSYAPGMQPAPPVNPLFAQQQGNPRREMFSDILMAIGTGLASGNMGNSAQMLAQFSKDRDERKRASMGQNATMEWLKARKADDIIPLVQSGQITPMQAIQMATSSPDLPTNVREYEFARQQGFDGSFMDFQQAKRPQTNVNVNSKNETEYDKALGKSQAEYFMGTQTEGQKAQSALTSFDAMEQLMSQPGFYSGALGDQALIAKRLAESMGMDSEGVDSMEAFNALSKQSALDVMGGSLGTGFSNADRDFVLDQVPKISNTEPGNLRIIAIQRKLAERKIQIAQLAREYAQRNGGRIDFGFNQFLQEWANRPENRLFTPQDASTADQTQNNATADQTQDNVFDYREFFQQ